MRKVIQHVNRGVVFVFRQSYSILSSMVNYFELKKKNSKKILCSILFPVS